MKLPVFVILILCALGLYGIKYLNELHQNGTLKQQFEKATRKALRFTLKGIAVVGLALLALCLFPLVRSVGFALLSASLIDSIRMLLDAVLDTSSVYASIQIFASVTLLAVEFSLIFSILGLFVTKTLVIPHLLECSRMEEDPESKHCVAVAIPRTFRKIFLNFANLRI